MESYIRGVTKSLDDNYIGALKAEQELKKAKSNQPWAHFAMTMLQDGESDDVPSSAFIHDESDDVPSSAFIHGDNYEMVEHGILPSTTAMYDDLSDFCHHIESESDFTTSPIYDELPNSHVRRATTPTTWVRWVTPPYVSLSAPILRSEWTST